MLTIGIAVLLGVAVLLAFGFLKVFSDLKRSALASSRESFDEHFTSVSRFIDDPASPPELASLLVAISKSANSEAVGRRIVHAINTNEMSNRPETDARIVSLTSSLEQLGRHRPDLAAAFKDAVVSGFLGAAYRQIAREMSPVRAFRENQETKKIKRTRRPDDLVSQALRDFQSFGLPTVA